MTFLYINSNQMGMGEQQLGRQLLESFLSTLADSNFSVDLIGCVNSGIELTTTTGPALESLKRLEAKGARIATCGTCLDFHGKRKDLLIGEVGSMQGTVQIMSTADTVLRPC